MSRFYYFHPALVMTPPAPTGIQYAADYLAAAGITSSLVTTAAHQLEDTLRALGLLSGESRNASRIKALYPMAGSNALAHSINFVDPDQYRITWVNNPTHDANGVKFNGVDQYGDTNFYPSPTLTRDNTHLAFYAAESAPVDPNRSGARVIGSTNGPSEDWSLAVNRGELDYYCSTNNEAIALTSSPAPRTGLVVGCRTSNTFIALYRRGQEVVRSTMPDTGTLTGVLPVVIGQSSFNYEYSQVPCSWASMGEGLSPAEVNAYTAAVQQFQTTLGRAR